MTRSDVKSAIVSTVKEFKRDKLTVWAAALTYYSVLSVFPGLLVLVAVLGLIDDSLTQSLLDALAPVMPEPVREILATAIGSVQQSGSGAGLAALIGLAVAFWSASGYVGGFIQAANMIHGVPKDRPLWKTLPLRLGVTLVTGVLLVASILIVVLSGGLAERVGAWLGITSATVTVWNIAKWPVLILLVSLMFALLYWASPSSRQGGFRWITPGGLLAVLLWIVVSFGFAVYAANFGSNNTTYGTLAGVIVFLIWLWLSNLAVLLGAEFDRHLHLRDGERSS